MDMTMLTNDDSKFLMWLLLAPFVLVVIAFATGLVIAIGAACESPDNDE